MTTRIANPYAVLGVPPTAGASEVREAYRRLAKQVHPDQNRDAQATERMQRINQAWETLSNPAGRARYAAQSAAPQASAYPHWSSAPRRARPRYAAEPTPPETEFGTSPLRWAAVLVAVPILFFGLPVALGGILPFPVLGLLLFFGARVALRGGD
jgi:curved DNA-binding protein CbpA